MPSAVFLSDCITVHDYKNKMKSLSTAALQDSVFDYEIAACYIMKYDKYIWLCNHIDEWYAARQRLADGSAYKVALFYSSRADKLLLLSISDNKVAVIYNAGKKVEIRPNSHNARAARNAEKRRLRLLQKSKEMIQSYSGEDALELLNNLERVHTTEMGVERIRKNLSLDCDVVAWCKEQIIKSKNIIKQGKNWYVHIDGTVITVNAHSYTIITAHENEKHEI